MKQRTILKTVRGQRAVDGAGVRLVLVLGHGDVRDFDPFLMLDSFDSTDPLDYTAGIPWHPHRGIETITYLISGRVEHEDSLGNKGVILAGESQWMTAGSGILHQEMPKASDRMQGFQLWLNLPKEDKMTQPAYLSITRKMIPHVVTEQAEIAVLSGRYAGAEGVTPRHIPATLLDVKLAQGKETNIETMAGETAFVFTLEGSAIFAGQPIPEKTAVLFSDGEVIHVAAQATSGVRFMVFTGKPLREPVAWGGPIVMNTQAELEKAFRELDEGTFIKRR